MIDEKVFRLISQRDAAAKSYRKLMADRQRDWGLAGVSMGIHDFNLYTGGFLPQKVVVVAARSGIGKTGILNSFIDGGSMIRQGKRAAFLVFSWEMDPSLLVTREICRQAEVTQGLLLNGPKLLGEAMMKRIDEIYKHVAGFDVRYQTLTTDITVVRKITEEFVLDCEKKSAEEGVDIQPVVLIDFVQMAKSLEETLKTYQIQDFMVGSKNLANDTGANITMLAQLKRETDSKSAPTRDDLRDSASIEDNADTLMFLHRPEYNGIMMMEHPVTGQDISSEGKMMVRVLKDRNFGTRDFVINCDIKHFRFWNEDMTWDQEYHHLYTQKGFWMDHFGFSRDGSKQMTLGEG